MQGISEAAAAVNVTQPDDAEVRSDNCFRKACCIGTHQASS